jgi:hypothetical protein
MKLGTLCGAMFMLLAIPGNAVAQPALPPSAIISMGAEQRGDIKASVATTKADIKTTAATRQQIQALRLALRAKLAAMRH